MTTGQNQLNRILFDRRKLGIRGDDILKAETLVIKATPPPGDLMKESGVATKGYEKVKDLALVLLTTMHGTSKCFSEVRYFQSIIRPCLHKIPRIYHGLLFA